MPFDDEARRKYYRQWFKRRRAADPEFKAKQNAATYKSRDERKQQAKDIVREAMAGGCAVCHEAETACLNFHHLDPSQKKKGISEAVTQAWSKDLLMAELQKCICLCANCHRKLHAGHLQLPKSVWP